MTSGHCNGYGVLIHEINWKSHEVGRCVQSPNVRGHPQAIGSADAIACNAGLGGCRTKWERTFALLDLMAFRRWDCLIYDFFHQMPGGTAGRKKGYKKKCWARSPAAKYKEPQETSACRSQWGVQ